MRCGLTGRALNIILGSLDHVLKGQGFRRNNLIRHVLRNNLWLPHRKWPGGAESGGREEEPELRLVVGGGGKKQV